MNRKTVASVLDDLHHIGLVKKQPGQPLVIKLPLMKEEHFALFATPTKSSEVELETSAASTRPKTNSYEFRGDGFDRASGRDRCHQEAIVM